MIVFDDANQNRIQESGEELLPGGTITRPLEYAQGMPGVRVGQ